MTQATTIQRYDNDLCEEMAYWQQEVHDSRDDPQYQQLAATQWQQLSLKRSRFLRLVEQLKIGLELKSDFAWCILIRDATHEGQYRYQVFDERGFSGHVTKPTLEAAFVAAFDEGFTVEDDGTLLRFYGTDAWHHGMRAVHLAQQVNSGQTTLEQARRHYSA